MAKVVVYTKDACSYCERAKDLLNRKGIAFEEIYLGGKYEEMAALKERTGWMTMPQIFIGDQLVGGYQELSSLNREGKLDELVK